METKLPDLIKSLESLQGTIISANINEPGFSRYGWNQIHLNKDDISYFIGNFVDKLKEYGNSPITKGLENTIESHVANIDRLNDTSTRHFNDNAQNLLHIVPSILLTLNTIFSDVEFELFSYENIQDKKLLPRGLTTRLRGVKNQIDSISESSASLEEKIGIINDAHEAAESLPTDLASLKDAKKQLDILLKSADQELATAKKEIEKIKEEAISLKNEIKKFSEEAELLRERASKNANLTSKLVEECDDALQITTTQGLAAGFDQKAKELKRSIWIWIIGLLIALIAGSWIGSNRVSALTEALNHELTLGQVVLHVIMSIFSIGGSLWLAWISTQQINQRFKLSEDYSYKATVSKSFTGFKKFAERFDPHTEERLFNSTLDRLDEMPLRLIEGKDYNSPWHEFTDSEAFKNAAATFPTLAKEAGKFANRANLRGRPKQPSTTKATETKTTEHAQEPEES
ncbi:hypothetical protein [Microbulbifer rhizosphaerae]|uniref:Putative nucleic acid-binding Zn-ribbon protein n=1 Tax=Microbulbifer rhizosphaerae TaxID=1562603 RepID=A0A7W4Z8Z3_9GAMM|nr:hypothetical protein [Microbulbifer rhizosphaerae]MBB3059729.1 putative nucleic acid-binding Zn-ribbon protein [Microbulbifer rhizosphaerae]